ncbi:hypothetical protein H0A36_26825 [Endozoicomonas sp. SM1973]|uniref:Uncharacterized protein n=1 Tax=Spartinivicinus marinus TaxID=2994442 RepID=A0A853I8J1_9GAMM|nr:hypothetical protein [Spartinivicinus marinus]NYZ69633.1 hypothetical protein [Spartinivicinus marinus]
MSDRGRHPQKEVEEALQFAEAQGWQVIERHNGHTWGVIRCPNNDKNCRCGEFCQNSIWSTPRRPGTHAKQIKRYVQGCIYNDEGGDDGNL